MTTLGFVVYKYAYNRNLVLEQISILSILALTFFITVFSVIFFEDLYFEILNTVNGIITGEDGALASRDIYNEFRWQAISMQKELGYGYVHKSSEIMKLFAADDSNRFMESLGVVDSGFVDMLVKYGYIGTVVIIIVFLKFSITGFKSNFRNPLSLVMSMYLIQYLFINYTWSVFTYSHGIIPCSLAFFFLFESIYDYEKDTNPKNEN